ncbi:MAG: hypothetical protein GY822_20055 [Deltaproteobacteria bacterium]|nr:hypothetical protein [Deltaproteobacteria bacterium]
MRYLSLRLVALVVVVLPLLSACSGEPGKTYIEWVARDAWSQNCARKAAVETFEMEKKGWKVKDQIFLVDVKATYKLIDDCKGFPLIGKSYKASESVKFEKKGLEMSKCKLDGKDGWSIPGKESKRCWTGPTSVGEEHKPKKAGEVLKKKKDEEKKKAGDEKKKEDGK